MGASDGGSLGVWVQLLYHLTMSQIIFSLTCGMKNLFNSFLRPKWVLVMELVVG